MIWVNGHQVEGGVCVYLLCIYSLAATPSLFLSLPFISTPANFVFTPSRHHDPLFFRFSNIYLSTCVRKLLFYFLLPVLFWLHRLYLGILRTRLWDLRGDSIDEMVCHQYLRLSWRFICKRMSRTRPRLGRWLLLVLQWCPRQPVFCLRKWHRLILDLG